MSFKNREGRHDGLGRQAEAIQLALGIQPHQQISFQHLDVAKGQGYGHLVADVQRQPVAEEVQFPLGDGEIRAGPGSDRRY